MQSEIYNQDRDLYCKIIYDDLM